MTTPLGQLFAAWLMFQIVTSVISALATIYTLFCLGKTAAAIDRLATAVENIVERGNSAPPLPGQLPSGGYPVPYSPAPLQMQPQPAPQTVSPESPIVVPEANPQSNVPYIPRREVTP